MVASLPSKLTASGAQRLEVPAVRLSGSSEDRTAILTYDDAKADVKSVTDAPTNAGLRAEKAECYGPSIDHYLS